MTCAASSLPVGMFSPTGSGAGRCARTLRAEVFAAVCVLLAAVGHVLMSGTTVPWWALTAGLAVTGGAGWSLAGRERGLPLVVSLVVVTQGVLHSGFELAQSTATGATGPDTMPSDSRGPGHAMESMGHDMSAMPTHSMGMGHMATDHATHLGHVGSMGHDMGGMSSFGMLAAHTLAALLCGLWLAHGERAAFRVMRAVAGRLAAPLRLLFAVVTPPRRLRVRLHRLRSERVPRHLPLVHSITPRGPPTGTAVV
ncbi:hypothetical protein SLINC_0223 [Streptomyces lincolnensis]|uniref:Uncharacterized protein n=2 Tax=Streptomyces lincolnensis TaxID=1915 RepID=A0A1B1M1Z1_STRLN|nr:hypothetical protein SLINC_0223 [Streptomyces lincolnensis]AXG51372.1 hypothetical protein SLCG_0217 [Streptomyces lincolnensis]